MFKDIFNLVFNFFTTNKKKATIISAFPGTGKSYLFRKLGSKVSDSDSSLFSKLSNGDKNPDFPNNYIQHIKSLIDKKDFIFVSSHKEVREALKANNIPFILIYPNKSLLENYIIRYTERGNENSFIDFIRKNWYNFIEELSNETCQEKIELKKDEYISDTYLFK